MRIAVLADVHGNLAALGDRIRWVMGNDGQRRPRARRRSRYDVAAAERAIRASGYPDADDVVAAITGAVSREEALDAFSPRG